MQSTISLWAYCQSHYWDYFDTRLQLLSWSSGQLGQTFFANTPTGVIARRLGSFTDLTCAESKTLQVLGSGPTQSWPRQGIMDWPRKSPSSPLYIISGWAAHSRELSDGRRQLIDLLLPGDVVRPATYPPPGQAVLCITPVTTIDGARIIEAAQNSHLHPGIARAVELAAEEERARLMNHAVRLGRLTAYERLANVFVELHRRFRAIGLIRDGMSEFPLTQEMLGDLLGLSSVHVNRSLQVLRRLGLASVTRGHVHFADVEALEQVGGYNGCMGAQHAAPREPAADRLP